MQTSIHSTAFHRAENSWTWRCNNEQPQPIMPFGIVAYALMLFSWTTFLETAVYTTFHNCLYPESTLSRNCKSFIEFSLNYGRIHSLSLAVQCNNSKESVWVLVFFFHMMLESCCCCCYLYYVFNRLQFSTSYCCHFIFVIFIISRLQDYNRLTQLPEEPVFYIVVLHE